MVRLTQDAASGEWLILLGTRDADAAGRVARAATLALARFAAERERTREVERAEAVTFTDPPSPRRGFRGIFNRPRLRVGGR